MNIKFKDFEKHMSDVKQIMDFGDAIQDLCHKSYKNNVDCEIRLPTLVDNVIDLLEELTNDDGHWIGYWVYDLYCGDNYSDGVAVDSKGKIIKLKTIRDLWNLLVDNYNRKRNK